MINSYGADKLKLGMRRRLVKEIRKKVLPWLPKNFFIQDAEFEDLRRSGLSYVTIRLGQQLRKKVSIRDLDVIWCDLPRVNWMLQVLDPECFWIRYGNMIGGKCSCTNTNKLQCELLQMYRKEKPGIRFHILTTTEFKEIPWFNSRHFTFLQGFATNLWRRICDTPILWVEDVTILILWMGRCLSPQQSLFARLPRDVLLIIAKMIYNSMDQWERKREI